VSTYVESPETQEVPVATWTAARHRRLNIPLVVGGTLIGLLVLMALLGLVWTPADPAAVDLSQRLAPIGSDGHLLGTDNFGRDIASQLMAGAWNSLSISALSIFAAFVVGVAAGGTAAVKGGMTDDVIARASDVVFAFPAILLALLLAVKLGAGTLPTVLAIAITSIPVITRATRGAAKQVFHRDFVLAARGYGRSRWYILVRHVLPNLSGVLVAQAAVSLGLAILIESGLSFLGLGAQDPDVSWGSMLKDSQPFLETRPMLSFWPGVAIVLSVLGFNLVGEGLRDRLDPRLAPQPE
jgi:peptide/nickel transport system permease protein